MFWPDFIRYLIIVLGFALMASILVVMVLHWTAYIKVRCENKQAGLLPLHVSLISASYAMLVLINLQGVLKNIGQPSQSDVLFLYPIAYGMGLVSLFVMASRQGRRIRMSRSEITVHVEETTHTTAKE